MRRPSVREGVEEVTNEAMVEEVGGTSPILKTFRAETVKKNHPLCTMYIY